MELINQKLTGHILTVEDPIEFVYESKKSIFRQREVGQNTKSFGAALKSALRQDPDVILVGELRDLETIQLAVTAAETGHLCFGTLHTQDCPSTIDRIIDVFPPHQQSQIRVQLAVVLQGVVSPGAGPAQRRRGPRRRPGGHDQHPRRLEPHPGGQDPHDLRRHRHRRSIRHDPDGQGLGRPVRQGLIAPEEALLPRTTPRPLRTLAGLSSPFGRDGDVAMEASEKLALLKKLSGSWTRSPKATWPRLGSSSSRWISSTGR